MVYGENSYTWKITQFLAFVFLWCDEFQPRFMIHEDQPCTPSRSSGLNLLLNHINGKNGKILQEQVVFHQEKV